jgi:hypothetical protein
MPQDNQLPASHPEEERRQYIRLETVFPVQFRLLAPDGKTFLSPWQQGFTSNVSKGGLLLAVNNLNPELAGLLNNKQAKLSVDIEMPFTRSPISAIAQVAWVRPAPNEPNKFFYGIKYEKIDSRQNKRIMRYALVKRLTAPLIIALILSLAAAFAIGSMINIKLIKGNKELVDQLVKIVQESSVAKQKVKAISKEKEDLQVNIHALELRIKTAEAERLKLEQARETEKEKATASLNELNALVSRLGQEKNT